jgi:hypothetical protein
MGGTGPAAMRGFFLVCRENFCDAISLRHLSAFFRDFECYWDVSPTDLHQLWRFGSDVKSGGFARRKRSNFFIE